MYDKNMSSTRDKGTEMEISQRYRQFGRLPLTTTGDFDYFISFDNGRTFRQCAIIGAIDVDRLLSTPPTDKSCVRKFVKI